ncbi:hypothetical protein DCC62_32610 [candidate division KSB1 bacterium]|nr:MAG: hypothetical protein DCC62_32610 [candidate division KSB1 bacterium]
MGRRAAISGHMPCIGIAPPPVIESNNAKEFTMETRPARIFAIITLSLALLHGIGQSQPGYQFGQNKVQYKNFKWQVLRTAHFEVHYYPEAAEAAQDAARMAERGYAYLSDVLDHQIKSRIPLVLYASLNDFQQTNVVDGLIGDGTRGVIRYY